MAMEEPRVDNEWFTPKRKLILALLCYTIAGIMIWVKYG